VSLTSVPKDTAKTLLQRQVEKIPDLRAKGHRNPEFEPWRQQTLRIIKRIFGGSSDQAKQFDSIGFGLIAFTNRTPESAWEEAFQRGLAKSEGTLKSFAEELDLFEPVKTVTTKTKGSPPGDERAIVWDLFICHASEDKNEIAGPLAKALTVKGLSVWYDEFTLTLGDSLSRKIDEGLANSRFGVVILSPSFFKKEWPRRELDGLTAKEVSSGKTILPVWHNVDRDFLIKYSPVLADKLAVSTKEGLDKVVDEVLKVVNVAKAVRQPPSAGRVPSDDLDIRIVRLYITMKKDANLARFFADWENLKSALLYAGFPVAAAEDIKTGFDYLGWDIREDRFLVVARLMNDLYRQGTLAHFLTQMLRTGLRPKFQDEFLQHLHSLELDWDRTTNQIQARRRPHEMKKEIILAEAKPYEAYKQIENIIGSCRIELAIIDPWVGEDIFPLYLESVPASASIRILTQNMTGKFEAVAKRFSQERNRFEVRVAQVHDRYLIVDGRAWIIGQSLKDAGKRPLAITELSDADQARTLFEKLWNSSKKAV